MRNEKLFQAFDEPMDALHIKLDAFLNTKFMGEDRYLADEIKGKRLSPAARRYVAGKLNTRSYQSLA